MGSNLESTEGVVDEIMRLHRSLPARPSLEEVEAAVALIRNVEREEQARVDAVARQRKGGDVPEELFSILQEMERSLVAFQSKEQRREAERLMDLENVHAMFDECLQRASRCIPGSESYQPPGQSNGSVPVPGAAAPSKTSSFGGGSKASGFDRAAAAVGAASGLVAQRDGGRSGELFTRDDSYVKKTKAMFLGDGIAGELDLQSRGALADSAVLSASNVGELSFELELFVLWHVLEEK